jgi:hypothetical protein
MLQDVYVKMKVTVEVPDGSTPEEVVNSWADSAEVDEVNLMIYQTDGEIIDYSVEDIEVI